MAITQIGVIVQCNGGWGDHNWFNTPEEAIEYLKDVEDIYEDEDEGDEEE